MTFVDRYLQGVRIRQALRVLGENLRVIDVGAHEGELFKALGSRLRQGFGIEPLAAQEVREPSYTIQGGLFPDVRPDDDGSWDAVTMLAVLEHIPRDAQANLADACHRLLQRGGRVVITVPSPLVDNILAILRGLRLIDGMSLEEHYGFEPGDTQRIFSGPRFQLVKHARFQLGLNNLYVFEKAEG